MPWGCFVSKNWTASISVLYFCLSVVSGRISFYLVGYLPFGLLWLVSLSLVVYLDVCLFICLVAVSTIWMFYQFVLVWTSESFTDNNKIVITENLFLIAWLDFSLFFRKSIDIEITRLMYQTKGQCQSYWYLYHLQTD